jgi:hypothetical protein
VFEENIGMRAAVERRDRLRGGERDEVGARAGRDPLQRTLGRERQVVDVAGVVVAVPEA